MGNTPLLAGPHRPQQCALFTIHIKWVDRLAECWCCQQECQEEPTVFLKNSFYIAILCVMQWQHPPRLLPGVTALDPPYCSYTCCPLLRETTCVDPGAENSHSSWLSAPRVTSSTCACLPSIPHKLFGFYCYSVTVVPISPLCPPSPSFCPAYPNFHTQSHTVVHVRRSFIQVL